MNQNKNSNKGWKGIGRSLVVAVVGPDELAEQVHDHDVVVITLEGEPLELARRRALSPDLVDVVIVEMTGEDRDEWLELSRVLRSRYLATLPVLPRDRWGKRVFRSQIGVFRHRGRVVLPELWMGLSVAAQQTWTLGWLRLDKRRDISEVSRTEELEASQVLNVTIDKQSGLHAPALPGGASSVDAPPSRTSPWAPPPGLLVELTKAYTEER